MPSTNDSLSRPTETGDTLHIPSSTAMTSFLVAVVSVISVYIVKCLILLFSE
jgi:hypothetical protein